MQSVTLDSNILVSALNYGGPCLRILMMARAGLIPLDLSNSILEEVDDVLRKRFQWPEDDIVLAQQEIAAVANQVSPQERLPVVEADPDDDRIIKCANKSWPP